MVSRNMTIFILISDFQVRILSQFVICRVSHRLVTTFDFKWILIGGTPCNCYRESQNQEILHKILRETIVNSFLFVRK